MCVKEGWCQTDPSHGALPATTANDVLLRVHPAFAHCPGPGCCSQARPHHPALGGSCCSCPVPATRKASFSQAGSQASFQGRRQGSSKQVGGSAPLWPPPAAAAAAGCAASKGHRLLQACRGSSSRPGGAGSCGSSPRARCQGSRLRGVAADPQQPAVHALPTLSCSPHAARAGSSCNVGHSAAAPCLAGCQSGVLLARNPDAPLLCQHNWP